MGRIITTRIADDGMGIAAFPIVQPKYVSEQVASSSAPEFKLLLIIARVELSVNERCILQNLLDQTLEWDYLLSMAQLHGLEPLLFHHIRETAARVVPYWVIRTLSRKCKVIALRNLVLSTKLREISAHLTCHRIEHIAYKGPLLAEMYGQNGGLRTYRDLDILVPQKRLSAVRDALGELGFVDRYGLTEAQQAASFRSGFEHPFTSKAGIDLDVHWRVVQNFKSPAFDMDGVWARRTVSGLFDQDVSALSPEDLLVVLCLHAGHHGWMQLSHLCDLAQVFRVHRELDWKVVRGHLRDSNTRRIICISLHLLQKHWQVNLPREITTMMAADVRVEQLARRIEGEIWPAERPELTTSGLMWLLDRSAGESFLDRTRLLVGSIFVPSIEDFALLRLPAALSRLYAGLRMSRLVWKCLSSMWQRWWRSKQAQRPAF